MNGLQVLRRVHPSQVQSLLTLVEGGETLRFSLVIGGMQAVLVLVIVTHGFHISLLLRCGHMSIVLCATDRYGHEIDCGSTAYSEGAV
jgi:hypothetical protein